MSTGLTALRTRLLSVMSSVMRRTSVVPRIYGFCWHIVLTVLGTERTVTLAESEAVFRTTTRSEYVRTVRLGGERHVLRAFLNEIDRAKTVWDVGACVGTYACFATQRADHVVAFEPEATNRARLRENLRANAPEDRWTVSPLALSDSASDARLRSEFTEVGSGHHYVVPDSTATSDGGVRTARADTLVADGYPRPDVVKIDVQGAELCVIDGLSDTLASVETVFVEVHEQKCGRYGSDPDAVGTTLADHGFAVERLAEPSTNRSGVYFLRGTRR